MIYVIWTAEPSTATAAGRARYDVTRDGDVVVLIPHAGGSVARSDIRTSDYAYTHGGRAFRAAVDRAHRIADGGR